MYNYYFCISKYASALLCLVSYSVRMCECVCVLLILLPFEGNFIALLRAQERWRREDHAAELWYLLIVK